MQIAASVPGITAEAAATAVQAAVRHAEANGWKINAAVCDRGGNLMAFLRIPGAYIHSIQIAIDKAYTAASFGLPTAQWMSILAQDEALRIGLVARPRLVVFGGGLPIREHGVLIGGIGVSGGSAEQDAACAQAGIEALGLDRA